MPRPRLAGEGDRASAQKLSVPLTVVSVSVMGKTCALHFRKITLAGSIKEKQLKGCPVLEVILVRNASAWAGRGEDRKGV